MSFWNSPAWILNNFIVETICISSEKVETLNSWILLLISALASASKHLLLLATNRELTNLRVRTSPTNKSFAQIFLNVDFIKSELFLDFY